MTDDSNENNNEDADVNTHSRHAGGAGNEAQEEEDQEDDDVDLDGIGPVTAKSSTQQHHQKMVNDEETLSKDDVINVLIPCH